MAASNNEPTVQNGTVDFNLEKEQKIQPDSTGCQHEIVPVNRSQRRRHKLPDQIVARCIKCNNLFAKK